MSASVYRGGQVGVFRRVMVQHLTVVSLFSGAMGLDIGLEQTDRFLTLACVEKVPAFCRTIRHNRDSGRTRNPEMKVYECDINELDPEILMRDLGLHRGELDLLVGGPPCQSFSTSGRRGTTQDPSAPVTGTCTIGIIQVCFMHE